MYMLLAGKPPFEGKLDQDVFEEILHRDPDFYEGVWESISHNAKVGRNLLKYRREGEGGGSPLMLMVLISVVFNITQDTALYSDLVLLPLGMIAALQ